MTSKASTLNAPRSGFMDRLYRNQLLQHMNRLVECDLRLDDGMSEHRFGSPATTLDAPRASVEVHDPAFYRHIALGGSVGAAEAYMDGHWDCDDLTALMRILVRNRDVLDGMESGLARLTRPLLKVFHGRNRNTKAGSQRNIAAHYDLGNEFFELFLDDNLMYSSAAYRTDDETLESASRHKLDRICRKLALGPDDHVLEIGTGWGGFALHAASEYGCRVTTTTISRRQHERATERVRAAGLDDRITLLLEDYRDLQGSFDKLVSIEMIEAVGSQFLDTYMARCARLLKPEGMMLLQAITIEDHRYARALKEVDFIQRYIFPGSFIPSVSAITDSAARVSDLRLYHLEDIGPSYARTLAEWRSRFEARLDEVREQGYSEAFIRMWRFYLSYCEAGFLERSIGDVQMLLTRPRCRRPQLLGELG